MLSSTQWALRLLLLSIFFGLSNSKSAIAQQPVRKESGLLSKIDSRALPKIAAPKMFGSRLFRTTDLVTDLHWTKDGRHIIGVDDTRTIRSWSAITGQLETEVAASNVGRRIALFNDGKRIATHTRNFLAIYRIADGKELRSIEHQSPYGFRCVALINRDKQIAANLGDDGAAIWNVESGKRLHTFQQAEKVDLITCAPEGNRIAVATLKRTFHVIDVAKNKEIWKSDQFEEYIDQITYSPDGKRIATIDGTGTLRLWDAETGEILHTIKHPDPTDKYLTVVFSHDSKTMLSGEFSGENRIWDVAKGKELRSFAGVAMCAEVMALSPNGDKLAVGGRFETINLYDIKSGKLLAPLEQGHTAAVYAVGFTRDGKKVFTGGKDMSIRIWDKKNAQELHQLKVDEAFFLSLAAYPNGKTLVSGSGYDSDVRFWNIDSGKQDRTITAGQKSTAGVAISSDGKLVAYCFGRSVRVWDVAQCKERPAPPDLGETVRTLFFLPNSNIVVVANQQQIAVVDAFQGRVLLERKVLNHFDIESMAISTDGRYLAIGSFSMFAIWETATWQICQTYEGLDGKFKYTWGSTTINAIAFLSDGRIATGGSDHKIDIWDLRTRKRLQTLEEHFGPITALAVSSDGKELLSGSTDTTALLWTIPPIAERVKVELTEEQGERSWADLKSDDAESAFKSSFKMVDSPKQTLALLKKNVVPIAVVDEGIVRGRIANLSSNRFAVRQKAFVELTALDTLAIPALRNRLKQKPDKDEVEQIEKLLKACETWTGDRLRELRAVQCVEMIGTADAKKLLEKWSKGAADARLTREAKASLERLRRQP